MGSSLLYRAAALSLALCLPTFATAYLTPEPCSGNCAGSVHDPAVMRADDGTYFRFTIVGRINIVTALSLSGPWTYQGPALPDGSIVDLPGYDDLWAPDVIRIDDVYYLTYAIFTVGSLDSDIGVATSTDMRYWQDHGSVGVPSGSWNKIDPNLFQVSPN